MTTPRRPGLALLAPPALSILCSLPLAAQDNVLIVVADDVGVDQIGAYGVGGAPAPTPHLDELAAGGVRFDRAWANPLCSPTRACLLTGRYSFRTGVGAPIGPGDLALPPTELTLPELLDLGAPTPVAHAAIGKWHLGPHVDHWSLVGDLDAPNDAGFDHFAGTPQNVGSYYHWVRVEDGASRWTIGYTTSRTVDDALAFIDQAQEPWLCFVSFQAAHVPLQLPPTNLHSLDLSVGAPAPTEKQVYGAIVESMDTEIGRLLRGLGGQLGRTNVVFLGDNGSPPQGVVAPQDPVKAKGTLYEGGVRIPLIVSGPSVQQPGAVCDALVSAVDVFATAAALCGVDLAASLPPGVPVDGLDLSPLLADPSAPSPRAALFAERFAPNGLGPYEEHHRAARDARYKLIRRHWADPGTPDVEELYDLALDPLEEVDLLLTAPLPAEAQAAHDALTLELDALLGAPGGGGQTP